MSLRGPTESVNQRQSHASWDVSEDTGAGRDTRRELMVKPGQALLTTIDHLSIIVRDLEATLREYVERGGLGPWAIYTYAPPDLQNMKVHGQPTSYSMRLALAWADGILW